MSTADHPSADPAEIADFLFARYAEDQAVLDAWDATAQPRTGTAVAWRAGTGATGIEVSSERFAAELEAKSRILETCQATWDSLADSDEAGSRSDAEFLLRLLAVPYATHPRYRSEWQPS